MKLKSLISEGKTKLGKIEFTTDFRNDRIVLMARSSKDLDLLDAVKNSSNKDIRELLLPLLEKKSGLKFRIDYSYPGAGYAFKIEEDSILKLLENEMKLGNIVEDILNEGPVENKKVKALLDKHLKDLRRGGPNHLWAVMHILMGALSDANFHSESKKVAALFGSKAKYEGDPMGEKDLEEMYHYDLGPDVAKICQWDGKEIVNAMGFYISMTIGRPLGQKVEALVESKGMKLFKESVYLNEMASRTAVEIYGLTGLNPDAVQKFVDKFKLDIEKVYQFVKKGKLKDRMDFVTGVTGNPNNPYQKKMISMFGESVNEIAYDSQGNLKAKKQYKSLSDYEKVAKKGDFIWVGQNPKDFQGVSKSLLYKVVDKDSEGNAVLASFNKKGRYTIPQKNQAVIVVEGVVTEGKKRFRQQNGIGKSKYTISYHDGSKKHKDGSDFFDIQIFKNQKDVDAFKKALLQKGFVEESADVVNEANYKVYHKSFTDAAQEARAMAEKRGFEINEDDWQSQVALGGKNLRSRPGEGKTTTFTVGLSKDGKPQRKALQFQVYGMKNGYELNAYIN